MKYSTGVHYKIESHDGWIFKWSWTLLDDEGWAYHHRDGVVVGGYTRTQEKAIVKATLAAESQCRKNKRYDDKMIARAAGTIRKKIC